MTRILAIALLASLPACTTMPSPPPAVLDAVTRAEAAYLRIRPLVEMGLPYLAPERAARVRLALSIADRAFAAARVATTLAAQEAELLKARDAVAVLATAATQRASGRAASRST